MQKYNSHVEARKLVSGAIIVTAWNTDGVYIELHIVGAKTGYKWKTEDS
jgi:hypothetical protein